MKLSMLQHFNIILPTTQPIKILIVQDFFFNELSKRKESNVTTIVAVTQNLNQVLITLDNNIKRAGTLAAFL
jgi:hypothetical protein